MFKPSAVLLLLAIFVCNGVGAIKCYSCVYSADRDFKHNDSDCASTDLDKIPSGNCDEYDKCVQGNVEIHGKGGGSKSFEFYNLKFAFSSFVSWLL
jgi:hypothetical protein